MTSVLVVDDDADVPAARSAALKAIPSRAPRAALAALAVLDRVSDIELLLIDVVMPGLHGFSPAPARALFTGNAEMDIVQKDSGPKYGKILHKPLRPDELRREVAQALAAAPPS